MCAAQSLVLLLALQRCFSACPSVLLCRCPIEGVVAHSSSPGVVAVRLVCLCLHCCPVRLGCVIAAVVLSSAASQDQKQTGARCAVCCSARSSGGRSSGRCLSVRTVPATAQKQVRQSATPEIGLQGRGSDAESSGGRGRGRRESEVQEPRRSEQRTANDERGARTAAPLFRVFALFSKSV